jgi:hypothetical protein
VKATEIIEELERHVYEFGDGEVQIPDPIERWFYAVDRVERDSSTQTYHLVSDH